MSKGRRRHTCWSKSSELLRQHVCRRKSRCSEVGTANFLHHASYFNFTETATSVATLNSKR